MNSSPWLWHISSPLVVILRIIVTFVSVGAIMAPYLIYKLFPEVCLITGTLFQTYLLRYMFHKIELDGNDSLGKEF